MTSGSFLYTSLPFSGGCPGLVNGLVSGHPPPHRATYPETYIPFCPAPGPLCSLREKITLSWGTQLHWDGERLVQKRAKFKKSSLSSVVIGRAWMLGARRGQGRWIGISISSSFPLSEQICSNSSSLRNVPLDPTVALSSTFRAFRQQSTFLKRSYKACLALRSRWHCPAGWITSCSSKTSPYLRTFRRSSSSCFRSSSMHLLASMYSCQEEMREVYAH